MGDEGISSGKREFDKLDDQQEGALPLKRSKISKAELFKPPTNEELNRLRETENLYQSTLFRMQINELLSEVSLKDKRHKEIVNYFAQLTKLLKGLPDGKDYALSDQSWCGDIYVPLDEAQGEVKGTFHFRAPKNVELIGSVLHRTVIKPCEIDIAVEMPNSCIHQSDFLNEKYYRKRIFYLITIAKHIQHSETVSDINFAYHRGDRWKPILVIKPAGNLGNHVKVLLHTCVEEITFKKHRFHINKNSIRSSWCNNSTSMSDMNLPPDKPTPFYNTSVLQDLTMLSVQSTINSLIQEHSDLKHGIVLLKVWLKQRQLNEIGGMSGHVLTLYVIYLLKTKKISKLMSSYQIFRNTLFFLASSGFDEAAVTLAENDCTGDENLPTLQDFHSHFRLVFIDDSGHMNLLADMMPDIYARIKYECKLAIRLMEDNVNDSFTALFLTPMPFLHTFDYVFSLTNVSLLRKVCADRLNISEWSLIDRCGDYLAVVLPHLIDLLTKGLGRRIEILCHRIEQKNEVWPLTSRHPSVADQRVMFGYTVQADHYTSVLDKGPPADSPEAVTFASFWGQRSELRRFQDASICEAVVWPAPTLADKRFVCMQIIAYVLHTHAGMPPKHVVSRWSALDNLLRPDQTAHKPLLYGTGEEQTLAVLRTQETLSKCLRKLPDLPLSIESVKGVSPVFSYAEVFPSTLFIKNRVDHRATPITGHGSVATYAPCMKLVCTVEGSGKWPEDREAIRYMKAAFYIKMAEGLSRIHGMSAQAYPDHMLTVQDGHLFSIVLAVTREIAVLKMVRKPNGMLKMVDTEEAVRLERDVIKLPLIRGVLHALQQQYNTYTCAVRLAKRWLSSQHLLEGHVDELVVELITAYVYIHPSPYSPPRSGMTGFMRVLKLLATWDWRISPLIVNFSGALTRSDYEEIQETFDRERANLPLMYIATSYDRKSMWTRHEPLAPVLKRLAVLANETVTVLERQCMSPNDKEDFKMVFRAPLDIYDVVIRLDPRMLSRAYQAVDVHKDAVRPHLTRHVTDPKLIVSTQFDPVERYVHQLRACYGASALFFYDVYGGDLVGVIWKPDALTEKPFKVANMNYHHINVNNIGKKTTLIPNLEAIMDDFKIIGLGLVKDVEVRKK